MEYIIMGVRKRGLPLKSESRKHTLIADFRTIFLIWQKID